MKGFNNKKLFIMFLILFISVGFAFLSANLNIRGLVGYKASNWDVHFENIEVISDLEGTSLPVINSKKNQIDFSLSFSEPGEKYEFSVEVVNDGNIDAMVEEIVKNGINESNEEFLDFNLSYFDGSLVNKKDLLKSGAKIKFLIKVNYKYNVDRLPDEGNCQFSLLAKFVRATDEANDVGQSIYESKNSSIVTLLDAKADSLSNLKIYGDSSQQQNNSRQLIKKQGLSTSTSDKEFWVNRYNLSTRDNGWCILNVKNNKTSDYEYGNFFISKEGLELEPDTDYTAFVEYVYVSGKGAVLLSQKNAVGDPIETSSSDSGSSNAIPYTEIAEKPIGVKKFLLHTKADLTDAYGLRGFCVVEVHNSFSIKLRVMIVKGNHLDDNYEYEDYNDGEPYPNINNPKVIHSVDNNLKLTIHNKNLINVNASDFNQNGVTAKINDDGSITLNGRATVGFRIPISTVPIHYKKNQKYIHKVEVLGGSFTPAYENVDWEVLSYPFPDENVAITDKSNYFEFVYIPHEDSYETPYLWIGFNSSASADYGKLNNFTIRLSLEVGDKSTDYSIGKSKSYPISLGNLQLNAIGDKKDYIYYNSGKWMLHKEINAKVLAGNFSEEKSGVYVSSDITNYDSSVQRPFSTHFVGVNSVSSINDFDNMYDYNSITFSSNNDNKLFIKSTLSLVELNDFLNNNVVKIYYVLNKPEEVEIEDNNLISQLNSILSSNLYEENNYITTSGDGLKPSILFDYKKLAKR